MASVALGKADLALFSNPGPTRVVIPSLMAMPRTLGRDKAFVRFHGDEFPTAFHGEGRQHTFALTCRYSRARHAELAALLELLDEVAPAAPDSRLLLRTHVGLVAGLDVAVAVEVDGDVTPTPVGAAAIDVTFTVRVVQHSLAV